MGLFSKEKELCPICGEPLKLFKLKLKDATVCKQCERKSSADNKLLKAMDLEAFKENLVYYDECVKLFEQKQPTYSFKVNSPCFYFDEVNRMVYIEESMMLSRTNYIVLHYDDIKRYELIYNSKSKDSSDKEGETYLLSKGGLALNILSTSSTTNETMRFILQTTNKYWPVINLEIIFPSNSTHWKEILANAQNVGRCFKAIVRGYSAEEFLKNGDCYVGSK